MQHKIAWKRCAASCLACVPSTRRTLLQHDAAQAASGVHCYNKSPSGRCLAPTIHDACTKPYTCSVAKKFLDDVELGSDSIRNAVVEFMPYSFAAVNAQSKRFLEVGLTCSVVCMLPERSPQES